MGLREWGRAAMLAAMLGSSAEARAEEPKPTEHTQIKKDKTCDTSCEVVPTEKRTDRESILRDLKNLKAEIQDYLPTPGSDAEAQKNWDSYKKDFVKDLDTITQSNQTLFEQDQELFKLRKEIVKMMTRATG